MAPALEVDDAASGTTAYANKHIHAFLSIVLSDPSKISDDQATSVNPLKAGDVECSTTQAGTITISTGKDAPSPLSQNTDSSYAIQHIQDGSLVTKDNFLTEKLSMDRPVRITDTPESIGMTILRGKRNDDVEKPVTVRNIADIVGHDTPVNVIDVEHQDELEGWNFGDLVEYFENESRLAYTANQTNDSKTSSSRRPQRRKAALKFLNKNRHRVLNQISFEFSRSNLDMKPPTFVRELDWTDTVWPNSWRHNKRMYPEVQKYILTSAAGAYTDFHVDFGGTSVFYTILSGAKEFCLIPPTTENLQKYEEWLCHKNQSDIFLPSMIKEESHVIRLRIQSHESLYIPSGWIHAVYTPVDSIVFGGNFLHNFAMKKQIEIYSIEVRTRVLERFRFPYFVASNFYAAGEYLAKLRQGNITEREVTDLPIVLDALENWWNVQPSVASINVTPLVENFRKFESQAAPTIAGAAVYAAMQNKCVAVVSFLSTLRKEYERVSTNGISPNLNVEEETTLNEMGPAKPKLRLRLKINKASGDAKSDQNIDLSKDDKKTNEAPPIEIPQPENPTSLQAKSVPKLRITQPAKLMNTVRKQGEFQARGFAASPRPKGIASPRPQTMGTASPKPVSKVASPKIKISKLPQPPPRPTREDSSIMIDEEAVMKEEEWLPGPDCKINPMPKVVRPKRQPKPPPPKRPMKVKTPTTTSRQRLLKKAKW